jgi:hypothetical protein
MGRDLGVLRFFIFNSFADVENNLSLPSFTHKADSPYVWISLALGSPTRIPLEAISGPKDFLAKNPFPNNFSSAMNIDSTSTLFSK